MGDDNLMDVSFADLDLNQETTEPALGSVTRVGSLLSEFETAHGRIEERIRQLEGVSARARQRQNWRREQNTVQISHFSQETMANIDTPRITLNGVNSNTDTVARIPEKGKGCKRDSSHLVAKALGMDSDVKRPEKELRGSFYDCNICLEMANEPVLTCCGHLFCWACFYHVADIDSTSKECPVCKGEVSNNTIIPIYGNGGSESACETKSGLKIPPRPKARRVESVRQQRVTHGLSHVPVAEALRRIRISIGSMGPQTQQQEGGSGIQNLDSVSHDGQQNGGSRRIRIHQVSRVSAASLSSLSSALSNAERLVEDLETVINNPFSRTDVGNPLVRNSDALQSRDEHLASIGDLNAAVNSSFSSSTHSSDVSSSAVHMLTMRTSSEISVPVAPPYSLRRRIGVSRNSDVDSRDTRESRRRRLN